MTHATAGRLRDLARVCERQVRFARTYAPLYARLFALLGEWVSAPDAADDPVVAWLVDVGAERAPFDIPLLLLAGVHRAVLARQAPEMARFYPTAGGSPAATDAALSAALRTTILNQPQQLGELIRHGNVQTNETARGLIWLLPLQAIRARAVHLVDLGASAGLNLAAHRRAYQLTHEGTVVRACGSGTPPQFVTACTGAVDTLPVAVPARPRLGARIGCDMLPFTLDSAERETLLSAYIWPEQLQRMARLHEGISAFHAANRAEQPVTLHAVTLPDELPAFLAEVVEPRLATHPADEPVILYNTYMTNYLADKGASLGEHIGRWAAAQPRPVLWLQWEPTYGRLTPPAFGWLAYSAEWWHQINHARWHLGWVHPHAVQFEVDPAWERFIDQLRRCNSNT